VKSLADAKTAQYLEDSVGTCADFEHPLVPPVRRFSVIQTEDEARSATVCATADAVIRHWARWIRGFQRSSSEFLLDQAIRRSGSVRMEAGVIVVMLEPRPLDVALRISGQLNDLELFTGEGMTRVVFR
jgi:hypothetical protein